MVGNVVLQIVHSTVWRVSGTRRTGILHAHSAPTAIRSRNIQLATVRVYFTTTTIATTSFSIYTFSVLIYIISWPTFSVLCLPFSLECY